MASGGVFGYFASLKLEFAQASSRSSSSAVNASGLDCRVYAQDLVGAEATDITEKVQWSAGAKANTLVLPGDVISAVGTKAKSRSDDVSPPGLVIAIRSSSGPTSYE